MRFVKLVLIWANLAGFLSGCWDIKDLQDINYITAIGFDYVDGEYVVYVQLIDLSSVAKTEGGKPQQPLPVWTGKGVGETPTSAINSLYESSQLHVFHGHINAIIYSERVLKRGMEEVLDVQNRYYEMRYTPWVFATDANIQELLAVTPFFFLSPIASVLHQPKDNFEQQSTIKPITVREFVSTYHEPGMIVMLPSLNINTKSWKEGDKESAMLTIDGIHMLDRKTYKGKLIRSKVMGLRWVSEDTVRSQLLIRSEQDSQVKAVISLEHPKVKTTAVVEGEDISFTIEVKLTGEILQVIRNMTETEMERRAEEQVRDQIRNTFEEGLALQSDLLQLEHTLYRQHTNQWKKMREKGEFALSDVPLDIQVDVKLTSSSKLKLEKAK